MNKFTHNILLAAVVICLACTIAVAKPNHDEEISTLPTKTATSDTTKANTAGAVDAHTEDEEEGIVELNKQQIALAEIKVERFNYQNQDYTFYAPAEIISNAYKVQLISNRLESQVLKRHAALGDEVQQGDLLVTLFSEQMAQKQAMFINAYNDWQRTKGLDSNTLSEKQNKEIEIAYKQQYATLLSNGMSAKSINNLIKNQLTTTRLGQYQLHAETNGLIITDNFRQGQWLAAGTNLFEISDEHSLWVEAQLPPMSNINVSQGVTANVVVGEHSFTATVSQTGHSIDSQSRTRLVRLTIDNPDHLLHTGQFADVYFKQKSKQPLLQIPESALVNTSDGDWAVYVEQQAGHFKQVEVNVVTTIANYRLVNGLADKLNIVTWGAFFIASEQQKSGFDIHNH
ncbi:efflux RND transporter periplasmic adaptor subunit [Colwelliaceae bacterium BS250]